MLTDLKTEARAGMVLTLAFYITMKGFRNYTATVLKCRH